MTAHQCQALLAPFLPHGALPPEQVEQVLAYASLLLRWNAKMNLTAIRNEKDIVTRHFGESFFAAAQVFGSPEQASTVTYSCADVGSGAGFPGLPLKIYAPQLRMTLIEAQQRKATFLREVVRSLHLPQCEVRSERVEVLAENKSLRSDLVTLRAVERFRDAVQSAATLSTFRMALLVGSDQVELASELVANADWQEPIPVPQSSNRVVLIGTKHQPESEK